MPHNFVYKKGFSSEGALRSGMEKRPGTGEQPGKRKETDAAEGQGSAAMRRRPEPRKARRQVPYGILPCRPYEEESHSSKKEEWHKFRLQFYGWNSIIFTPGHFVAKTGSTTVQ